MCAYPQDLPLPLRLLSRILRCSRVSALTGCGWRRPSMAGAEDCSAGLFPRTGRTLKARSRTTPRFAETRCAAKRSGTFVRSAAPRAARERGGTNNDGALGTCAEPTHNTTSASTRSRWGGGEDGRRKGRSAPKALTKWSQESSLLIATVVCEQHAQGARARTLPMPQLRQKSRSSAMEGGPSTSVSRPESAPEHRQLRVYEVRPAPSPAPP